MEIFDIECPNCGFVFKIYISETDWQFYYSNGGDWGFHFNCQHCGNSYAKMKYYKRLIPIPQFVFLEKHQKI